MALRLRPVIRRFVLATLLVLAGQANAQVSEAPDPLFQTTDPLPVSLSGPFTTLIEERPKDEYLPGTISYQNDDGEAVSFDIEIRTRGHSRHEVCDYPPVLLNFKKKQTRGTLFEKQNKLKLVIPCKYSGLYEQIVLREYLAYRILNKVSDMSFRVRLLHVTFANEQKENRTEVRYAYLIEHKKRLAERFGMEELKIERASVAEIDPERLNLTSIFQFLIGNTDFSPIAGAPGSDCCHNYVLFEKGGVPPIYAVPYDFDQSGFVDAPYAIPAGQFGLRSVRQRLYRGRCANNEYLPGSLQRFRQQRQEIYALINEQEGLSGKTRKRLIFYIDQFYRLIDRPKDVQRYLIDNCVG